MRRLRAALAALLLAFGLADAATAQPAYSPAPWLADLDRLRDAMSARYPNLEWSVERGMDLQGLYGATRGGLQSAPDAEEARIILRRFISRFADGHLEIGWPSQPPPPAAPAAAPSPPPALCQRLGYRPRADSRAITTRMAGFRAVGRPTAPLPAGIVEVDGRKVGVLRVPIFSTEWFPEFCEGAAAARGLQADSPCDEACAEDMTWRTDLAFARHMREQLTALATERPDVLLVDIAANGGGDDSSVLLARLVTDRPVKKPRAAFIRSPESAKLFGERLASIGAAAGARGPQRAALRRFAAALAAAQAAASVPCDRSALWRNAAIACTGLVPEPVYDGPVPALDGEIPDWVWYAAPLARYRGAEPIWRGPVVVLVDGYTASSSELFAAMLQDAGAAVVLGAPTAGSGCGHVTSAPPVALPNTGGKVVMPDCVRLRADGTNEVAGIQPDVLVGLREFDTPKQRLALVLGALPRAVEAAIARDKQGR